VRPTVSEQLEGTARILREVVAPAVEGAYPADILAGLIATLDALARGWPDVPAFLAWDAARALELLDGVAPELTEDLREALGRVASEAPDALDVRALEAHHAKARALLADAVAAGAPPGLASALAGHARERAARYPVQAEQRMPGQR
jgi:hypothetical protein